jgi:hypothetical protein
MHHHLHNWEKSISLSFILVSGPGEFSRVESNYAYHRDLPITSTARAVIRPPPKSALSGGSDYILSREEARQGGGGKGKGLRPIPHTTTTTTPRRYR